MLTLPASRCVVAAVFVFTLTSAILRPDISSAQAPKKPAQPALPGIPELPPGIELPDDVKQQLEKALKEAKALQDADQAKQPPATKPMPARPNSVQKTTQLTPTPKPAPATKTAPATKPGPVAPPAAIPPSAPADTTFKRTAKETPLGKVGDIDFMKRDNKKPHFWVSPDGRRLAYLFEKGIVVDGKSYQYTNSIRQADQFLKNFRFSPDSRHTSWIIHQGKLQGEGQGETLVLDGVPETIGWNFIANHDGGIFSPDSKHIAYTARRYAKGDVEYVLMVDGQEREVFLKSPAWALTFSPDSQRVIWAEDTGDHYEMRETSVDGKQSRIDHKYGPAQLTMNFFYGPAGEVGFIASQHKGNKFIVYDGKELTPTFKDVKNLQLSADGKHFGFVMEPASFRDVVVFDGKSSPSYGGLEADYVKDSFALSPAGGRYAYAIEKSRVEYPVIDGKPSAKGYSRVAQFTFSPDGKRLAHWAVQNGKLLLVADGRESVPYEDLGVPVFSPDSKSLAYVAGNANRNFMVINGQPQKAYVSVSPPQFSGDGKRVIYLGDYGADEPMVLVDGGKEGKQYPGIQEPLYFSPAGQRVAMVTYDKDYDMVVVDGVEGNQYDTIITLGGGQVAFDGEDQWHYLAVKDGELLLVEEAIEK